MATIAELEEALGTVKGDFVDLENRYNRAMDSLESKVTALTMMGPLGPEQQCTAELPHTGQMSYATGRYLCRCGMRYSKDGRGGLRVEG